MGASSVTITPPASSGSHPSPARSIDQLISFSRDFNAKELLRCCFVEFLGDMIFVFAGEARDFTLLINEIRTGTLSTTSGITGDLGAACAHGLTIALLVAAMGHIR